MFEFVELAHKFFDPLANRNGLQCMISSESLVRYESNKIFLQIRIDAKRSYEVGVELGQLVLSKTQSERPFNLAEILRLSGSDEAKYVENLQARQTDVLAA